MIVVRRALVGVAVDRCLKKPVVVGMVGMVELLVHGDCKDRHTGHGP